jgi:hypothetical protein
MFPDEIDDDDAADALSYGGEKSKKPKIHPAMDDNGEDDGYGDDGETEL